MSYFTSTIEQADRILDQLEALRRTMATDPNAKDAIAGGANEIGLAKDHVRYVRDRLISCDHDIARAQK